MYMYIVKQFIKRKDKLYLGQQTEHVQHISIKELAFIYCSTMTNIYEWKSNSCSLDF